MEDHRSPRYNRIPYLHSLKGSFSALTHYRASTKPRWLFLEHIFRCTNARAHVDSGAPGGKERRALLVLAHFPATPYSLRSTVSHLDISGGFHNLTVLSEKSTIQGEKVDGCPAPREKLAARTIPYTHAPSIIASSAASIGVSLRIRCWWNLGRAR